MPKPDLAKLVKLVQNGTISRDEFAKLTIGDTAKMPTDEGYGPEGFPYTSQNSMLGEPMPATNKHGLAGMAIGGVSGALHGGPVGAVIGGASGALSQTNGDLAALTALGFLPGGAMTGKLKELARAKGLLAPAAEGAGRWSGAAKGTIRGIIASLGAQNAKSLTDKGEASFSPGETAAGGFLGGLAGGAGARPTNTLPAADQRAVDAAKAAASHQADTAALAKQIAAHDADTKILDRAVNTKGVNSLATQHADAKAALVEANAALNAAREKAGESAQGQFLGRQREIAGDIQEKRNQINALAQQKIDAARELKEHAATMAARESDTRSKEVGEISSQLTAKKIDLVKAKQNLAAHEDALSSHTDLLNSKEEAARLAKIASLKDDVTAAQNRNTVLQKTGRNEKGQFVTESEIPGRIAKNTVLARLTQNAAGDVSSGATSTPFTHSPEDLEQLGKLTQNRTAAQAAFANTQDEVNSLLQKHVDMKNGITPSSFVHPDEDIKKLSDLTDAHQSVQDSFTTAQREKDALLLQKARHLASGANNSPEDTQLIAAQEKAAQAADDAHVNLRTNQETLRDKLNTLDKLKQQAAELKASAPPELPGGTSKNKMAALLAKAMQIVPMASVRAAGSGLGAVNDMMGAMGGQVPQEPLPPSILKKLFVDRMLAQANALQPAAIMAPNAMSPAPEDPAATSPQQ